jgi:hypothetical protein
VYNLTPYLQYHPGGADILVKASGRDATRLFNKYHPWVNLEGIASVSPPERRNAALHLVLRSIVVQKLVIGYLVEEGDSKGEAKGEAKGTAGVSRSSGQHSMDPPAPRVPLSLKPAMGSPSEFEDEKDHETGTEKEATAKGAEELVVSEEKGVNGGDICISYLEEQRL